MDEDEKWKSTKSKVKDLQQKITPAVFLSSMAGLMLIGGFASAFTIVKKQDPKDFDKGMVRSKKLPESGASFASKALTRATLYTFTGFGLMIFIVCKTLGVKNPKEFSAKINEMMPKAPKKESKGRNEFDSFRELFTYLEEEDKKTKEAKLSSNTGSDYKSKMSIDLEKDKSQ